MTWPVSTALPRAPGTAGSPSTAAWRSPKPNDCGSWNRRTPTEAAPAEAELDKEAIEGIPDKAGQAERRALPNRILMDNGLELTSKATLFWSKRTGTKLHFIQPGKPTQNAFVESFKGRFRDYCLDLNWFAILEDAREVIEGWRVHYNQVRPHRSLGKKPPAVFAKEAAMK